MIPYSQYCLHIVTHSVTLISLIVPGYDFLPWNLAAKLSLSSKDSHSWKKTCSGVCKSQLPFVASPPGHRFLQIFSQTLTSSCKEQVQLLDVINSSGPIAPLLKSRKWCQILCSKWQRLGVRGNSRWADSFSHCWLFAFVKVTGRISPLQKFAFHSCKVLQQGWVASCFRTWGRSRLSVIITAI